MEFKRPIIIIAAFLIAATVNPCSFYEDPLFFLMKRPDSPIADYTGGRLGVLLPSYARSHLIVAWRHLDGRPPSAEEQKEILAVMAHRLGEGADKDAIDAKDVWLDARNEIAKVAKKELDPDAHGANYSSFINCTDDAFFTAAATLKARAKTYGPAHAAVHEWIAAQDAVFDNCPGASSTPAPPESNLPPIMRADRAYQIAAAAFYAQDFDRAHELFTNVAKDNASPWHHTARLVAARSLLRKASLTSNNESAFAADIARRAESELQAIVSDAGMREVHPAASQLLDYIHLRTEPEKALASLARQIDGGAITKQRLIDFTLILDDDQVIDEMTDWIATFKRGAQEQDYANRAIHHDAASYEHAVARWREKHSLPWLIAGLEHARPESPHVSDLLEASAKIDAKSPAYLTVVYHRARLLGDRARGELDRALADEKSVPPSAHNLLLSMRAPLATSIEELVRDAVRAPAGTEEDGHETSESTYPPMFDEESAMMLNRSLPLSSLIAGAHIKGLAVEPRAQLLCAAWTRAALLKEYEIAAQLAPEVAKARPDLKELMETFAHAAPDDRPFAALAVIAHAPGLSPYVEAGSGRVNGRQDMTDLMHAHVNWWCERALSSAQAFYPDYNKPTPRRAPAFAAAMRDEVEGEQRRLDAAGSGPTYLLRSVMAWAKEKPKDRRVPEALALAIRGTQWACPDSATRSVASQAFKFLHANYGETSWAKRARYWYSGRD
jgi:hypothetical protein